MKRMIYNFFKNLFIFFAILSLGGVSYYLTDGFEQFDKGKIVENAKIGFLVGKRVYLTVTKQRCSKPIKYSLGTLDEEFNISKEDLLNALKEAEKVWEESAQKNLFDYDPEADFKINLIYDERQKINQEKKALEEYTKEIESKLKKWDEEYRKMDREYSDLFDYLISAGEKLTNEMYDHNMEVIGYNYGFEYDKKREKKLNKRGRELNARRDKLIRQENYLNSLAKKMNDLAEEQKKLTEEYNKKITEFNKKYDLENGREFDDGEYRREINKQEINIYAFWDQRDLVRVLSHELGHALGIIGHVGNSESIMYYMNEDQGQEESLKLTNEDKMALEGVCDF